MTVTNKLKLDASKPALIQRQKTFCGIFKIAKPEMKT
tara:strand:- start:2574 stop:2684 length:111 start_codon:yes stop_codon:yes gene_type:complete